MANKLPICPKITSNKLMISSMPYINPQHFACCRLSVCFLLFVVSQVSQSTNEPAWLPGWQPPRKQSQITVWPNDFTFILLRINYHPTKQPTNQQPNLLNSTLPKNTEKNAHWTVNAEHWTVDLKLPVILLPQWNCELLEFTVRL